MTPPYNVLFLCTGNSARSILSEALCNDLGGETWRGFSAGSHPSGEPHPEGLSCLKARGHMSEPYSSKSWDVFEGANAPRMDIIITVCSNAENEVCPVWPRKSGETPITAHWPAPDPAHVETLDARVAAFASVYDLCKARIQAMLVLDMQLPRDPLTAKLRAIGDIT